MKYCGNDIDIDGKEEEKMQSEVHKLAKISGLVGAEHFDELVFDCVFKNSIEESLLMEDMWKSRAKPTPLSFSDFQNGNLAENTSIDIRKTPSIEECFKQWKDSNGRKYHPIDSYNKQHSFRTCGGTDAKNPSGRYRQMILYDFDFEDNLEKPLSDLGIQDGTFLTFTFESEDDDITIHPLVIFFYNRPSIDNDNQLELVSTAKNLGGTNGISERLNSCKKRKLSETDSDLKEEAFSHPSGNAKKARLDTEVSNHLVIEDSDDDHVEQNASLNSAVFIVDDSD
ncbi:hypothetical protein AX774_g51 [Zancudomyces culisetae]|uniref:Uncharacterized protein n=1 Tax=Zancudomyces culisetae TaxID=1213189 RepID=A0A1R1PZJ6_ZANCU|nr:hypothetical protein AX774_g51 [Zancudomyces culisetae]|eukprot:OMH86365.1 hypothetical protein AX774_g51 [Zancudomyces culisetae]